MRVLFLTLYPESAASPRYRVHQYLPGLRAAGHTCDVACAVDPAFWSAYHAPGSALRPRDYLRHERGRRKQQLLAARDYDVVVLQKAITTVSWRGLHRLLEPVQSRLVYDIDDAVHLAAPDRLPKGFCLLEDAEQLRKVMGLARLTIAGNEWLAGEVQRHGGRAEVVPTVVDTDHYTPQPQPDEVYRIGWMGSPATAPYLDLVARPVSESGAACLVVGAPASRVPFPAECRAWSVEEERAQLGRMSVGLMPLPDTPWAQGKCALKALLYMACGRPVVCSAGAAADTIVEHGRTGYLCRTDADWRDAIEALRDPGPRAEMGAAARRAVEERYSLRVWAPRMKEILESIA
ncbi:MAG: glycosyltransferase [Candidatus Hydrogenedens sp.]|nr:glycosyltransferase [Candidatus Hydrogenedens sp.]